MVPTVRLELTRLAPPPPQDGVSTNSTTSAIFSFWFESRLLSSKQHFKVLPRENSYYLSGTIGTSPGLVLGAESAGAESDLAPEVAGALGATNSVTLLISLF